MTILVSVVVPTCRRPELLDRCLQALMAQDFDPSAYEVIVVDDAAESATQRLVERWAQNAGAYAYVPGEPAPLSVLPSGATERKEQSPGRGFFVHVPGLPRLTYLSAQHTQGPAAARNLGWRAAEGEFLGFTDDDCIPQPHWLKNGIASFSEGVLGVSGRVEVPLGSSPTDYELDAAGLVRSRFVTANCFYRRSALLQAGGFDERFRLPWREDSDLFFTLLEGNGRLVDAPDAVVVHPVRPAPWGISLKQQRKSAYNALLYKKHPQSYRRWLQPTPPWRYYAILLALVGVGVAVAAGSQAGALLAGLTWLGLTLHFSFQRLHRTVHSPRHILEMLFTSTLVPPLCIFWRLYGAYKFRVLFF